MGRSCVHAFLPLPVEPLAASVIAASWFLADQHAVYLTVFGYNPAEFRPVPRQAWAATFKQAYQVNNSIPYQRTKGDTAYVHEMFAPVHAASGGLPVPAQWVMRASSSGADAASTRNTAAPLLPAPEPYRRNIQCWTPSRGKIIASTVTDVRTQGSGCESMHFGTQDAQVVAYSVLQLRATAAADMEHPPEPLSKKAKAWAMTNDNLRACKDISSRLGSQVNLQQFVTLKQQREAAIAVVHAVKASIREMSNSSNNKTYKDKCGRAVKLLRTTAAVTSKRVQASFQAFRGPLLTQLKAASTAAMEAKRLKTAAAKDEATIISVMEAAALHAYNTFPRKTWGAKASTCNINGVLGANCPLPSLPAGYIYKPHVYAVLSRGLFNLNVLVRYEQLVQQRTGVKGLFSQGSGFTSNVGWATDAALKLPPVEQRGKIVGPDQHLLLKSMLA